MPATQIDCDDGGEGGECGGGEGLWDEPVRAWDWVRKENQQKEGNRNDWRNAPSKEKEMPKKRTRTKLRSCEAIGIEF